MSKSDGFTTDTSICSVSDSKYRRRASSRMLTTWLRGMLTPIDSSPSSACAATAVLASARRARAAQIHVLQLFIALTFVQLALLTLPDAIGRNLTATARHSDAVASASHRWCCTWSGYRSRQRRYPI